MGLLYVGFFDQSADKVSRSDGSKQLWGACVEGHVNKHCCNHKLSSMARKNRKKLIRDIAQQQIQRLFELADVISETRPELSDRYIHLAKQIGMRHRVRIPSHLKRRMCKHCGKYLVPGRTCRVRLNCARVVITCHACGKQIRYPYKTQGNQ